MKNKYPIYVISKGRWNKKLTVDALERMKLPYKIVVEESEYELYKTTIDEDNILILPQKYLDEYYTCDDLGDSKSKGPGSARNFCWDHSISIGAKRHWVMDDNIYGFQRLNNNLKIYVETGALFLAMEDFVDRYDNVGISGPNYAKFCISNDKVPPYITNTRIYSCLLIDNSLKYRWRGRYNEDTDICLRALKDGICTVQFNVFLQEKCTTQRIAGGNTKEFYDNEGTLNKSKMIEDLHSDVAKVVWKFNRVHHTVNYRKFKNNLLIKKQGLYIPNKINTYGMILDKNYMNGDKNGK